MREIRYSSSYNKLILRVVSVIVENSQTFIVPDAFAPSGKSPHGCAGPLVRELSRASERTTLEREDWWKRVYGSVNSDLVGRHEARRQAC